MIARSALVSLGLMAAILAGMHYGITEKSDPGNPVNGNGYERRAKYIPGNWFDAIDAFWRAANYLAVGQIYLKSNPLLKTPLTLAHIKPRLLGHWGTTPGLNLLYTHLNRLINKYDLDAIFRRQQGQFKHQRTRLESHSSR